MMRAMVFVVVLTAGLLEFQQALLACRCLPPPPPPEELVKADVVFRGRLMAFDRIDDTGKRGIFLVSAIWKGPVQAELRVSTGAGGADCGFPFEIGQEYIVYAFGAVQELNTHTCTRTRPDEPAEAEALGPPLWEAPQAPSFQRSDPDEDGHLTISDAIRVLNYLFLGGFPPLCLDAADSNDNGKVELSDAVYHLGYIFGGTAAPPPPFPGCGEDPTADELDCERYAGCG